MALTKRLNKVGNSAGLTFDRAILRQVGWEIGTEVDIKVEGDEITLKRHQYAAPDEVAASAERMTGRHRASLEKLGQ